MLTSSGSERCLQIEFALQHANQSFNIAQGEPLRVEDCALRLLGFDRPVIHVPVSQAARCEPALNELWDSLLGVSVELLSIEAKFGMTDCLERATVVLNALRVRMRSNSWRRQHPRLKHAVKMLNVFVVAFRLFNLEPIRPPTVLRFQTGIPEKHTEENLALLVRENEVTLGRFDCVGMHNQTRTECCENSFQSLESSDYIIIHYWMLGV